MLDLRKSLIDCILRRVLKWLHYTLEVMLTCARWYVAYPLSLRHIEEMMQECCVFVYHSTVHRWAIKVLPVMAAIFRQRKRHEGGSWRMDGWGNLNWPSGHLIPKLVLICLKILCPTLPKT